jgi:dihydrofolate reductase
MTPLCKVFIATSLDGYIAREDGSIDWLDEANRLVPPGEDCGYSAFIASVDAIVMGRGTFDTVSAMADWPYGATPVYVLSRSLSELPSGTPQSVHLVRGGPEDALVLAAARGHGSLYIDGGRTIQAFLAAGLISEMTITVIPILLGSGRSLFGPLAADIELQLVSSRAYSFGFVQSHYRVGE